MKKVFLILAMISCSLIVKGQEREDSTLNSLKITKQEDDKKLSKSINKDFYIGFDFGAGLGWRHYQNINGQVIDNLTIENGETPGISYNYNLYCGFAKKRFGLSFGLEYDNIKFENANATYYDYSWIYGPWVDSVKNTYKYYFMQNFLSIPLNVSFYFGHNKTWSLYGVYKFSWLRQYYRYIEYTGWVSHSNFYSYYSSNYFVSWFGGGIKVKIINGR